MDVGRLVGRDESEGAAGITDPTTQANAGGRETSDGESGRGEEKEQGMVRPEAPTAAEEDRRGRLGVGLHKSLRGGGLGRT